MSHAEFVESLADLLGTKLEEFGVFLAPADSIPAIVKWTLSTSVKQNVSVNELIASTADMDEVATAIRDSLLLEMAEERPGTDPWQYESDIPVPLPIAMMTVHTLTVCTRIAMDNTAPRWAHATNSIITQWSTGIADLSLTDQIENGQMDVQLRNGYRPVMGPIVKLPQPGLAYTARMIESFAKRIDTSWWRVSEEEATAENPVPEEVDAETKKLLVSNMQHTAKMLRDFNERFGTKPQPHVGS